MALKAIVQEKDMVLVSENPATKAALTFRFASDNAIKLSFSDVASLFKTLVEQRVEKVDGKEVKLPSVLSELNKKLKATEGISLVLEVKDFGADDKAV